ncbi:alpha/beta fold hydrolase [Noviherbaspirillum sedimenti]|nr:alpha/beta hydrolase [Noviherbaspirillum sedimenti]
MDHGKPPLLFAHGFLAHSHWWDFIAPFFMDRYRVFALDFSGMGDSEHRSVYDIAIWRDEIAAVARHLDDGPVTLVAHSFGGARAVEACATYHELFRQLVVLDSYLHFEDNTKRQNRFQSSDSPPRRHVDLASAMRRYRLIPDQDAPVYIKEHLARHSLRRYQDGWGWKFDELALIAPRNEPDSTKMLAKLALPVSLVFAQHSRIATRERMQRITKLLPNCNAVIEIPAANHHLFLDQSLAVVSCLRTLFALPR